MERAFCLLGTGSNISFRLRWDLTVPLEFMILGELRMKDFDQVRQNQIRARHAFRPIIVAAGWVFTPVVQPDLTGTECFEFLVSGIVGEHLPQALPRVAVDPVVRARSARD